MQQDPRNLTHRPSRWAALRACCVLLGCLGLMDSGVSQAAPPSVYHSPTDDGVGGGVPASVPSGAAVTLHLYLGIGGAPSGADPCLQGDGDEVCGFQIRLNGTTLALQSFTPDDPDTLFNLSGGQLDLIGGDFQAGDLGPTKLGDLVIEAPVPGGVLELTRSEFVNAQLVKEMAMTPETIVTVPEPGTLGLLAGWLLLFGLSRAERPRRVSLGAAALVPWLALIPTPAHAGGAVFGSEQTISTTADGADAVAAADIDKDGDLDVLSASVNDDTIAWYENTDGLGTFVLGQVITTTADAAHWVYPADVDGDGDLDALTASELDDTFAWYENTDGQGTFAFGQTISTTLNDARSIVAADVDGDGDLDVFTASFSDDTITWYENTDGQGSFSPAAIPILTTADGAHAVVAADVDGDGDMDAISASFHDDAIAWHRNITGDGFLWSTHSITATADGARSVFAADLDRDGDVDVLSASELDDTIAWYENTDGLGTFGPAQAITTTADGPRSVSAADVDGDGDFDVVAASAADSTIAWYENTDGQGSFGSAQTLTTAASSARSAMAGDVDGDGDLDVLAASFGDDTIAWYENQSIHRGGAWSAAGLFAHTEPDEFLISIFPVDVDGDGDLDVLAGTSLNAYWFANDGQGVYGGSQAILSAPFSFSLLNNVSASDLDGDGDADALLSVGGLVHWYSNPGGPGAWPLGQWLNPENPPVIVSLDSAAADLDGDGDLDVIAAAPDQDTVAWFQNTDGLGSFSPLQTITTTADDVRHAIAADVDGDGDLDVLAASFLDDTVAWYENTDGLGSFGPTQAISTTADGAYGVFAADLDDDGDLDVVATSELDDTIAWYENTDGLGSFTLGQAITAQLAVALAPQPPFAVDVDGDGDLDLLVGSHLSTGAGTIAWYENTDGLGSYGPPQLLLQQGPSAAGGTESVDVFPADVDGDGDLDVLSARTVTLGWHENTDGRGTFASEIGGALGFATKVFSGDVDSDGDLDSLKVDGPGVVWFENVDGQGRLGSSQSVAFFPFPNFADDAFVADVDGDGDTDVVLASADGSTIAWSSNDDGLGGFGALQIIDGTANGPQSVFGADLDGDGDTDVVSGSEGNDTVAWYANDGSGGFGPEQVISSTAAQVRSVSAADLDGDGDLDVLSASPGDNAIAWYANNGLGAFGAEQLIATGNGSLPVLTADVDGDGDLDVISSARTWYENTDGLGTFAPGQTIAGEFLGDVDADGDLDVLGYDSASLDPVWQEHTDGLGSFGPAQPIRPRPPGVGFFGSAVAAWDADGDADVDLLVTRDLACLRSTSCNLGVLPATGWERNRSGQVSFASFPGHPAWVVLDGTQVELLRIDLTHRGKPGDADAELATVVLQLDGLPPAPFASDPARPPSSVDANALFDSLLVYRDDGSGSLETGSDALVATVGTLALTRGIQIVTLADADPNVQVSAGQTGRFFVVAQLTATPGLGSRALRMRHIGPHSEVHHTATDLVLTQAPGTGGQPLPFLLLDPSADEDSDSLDNASEVAAGTDPFDPDSDADGLTDGDEVDVHGTNPLNGDSDGDGLSDPDEVNVYGTDPLLADTDGDGLSDADEVNVQGTNPLLADTDGDGLSDGDEAGVYGTDPLVAGGDSDGDGLSDFDEIAIGRHPGLTDTDGDGIDDDIDNCPSAFNPLQEDTAGFGDPAPDGVGDLCQNGDFDGDGEVDVLDVTLERRGLIGLEPTLDPAMPPSAP